MLAGLLCLQLAFYGFAFSGAVLAVYVTKWCLKSGTQLMNRMQNAMRGGLYS